MPEIETPRADLDGRQERGYIKATLALRALSLRYQVSRNLQMADVTVEKGWIGSSIDLSSLTVQR